MSPVQWARVRAEAKRMIDEELTLRDLRKAHQIAQVKLAAALGVKQESISNLENPIHYAASGTPDHSR
jgi:DNA-binding XRE family transcriptional regulator